MVGDIGVVERIGAVERIEAEPIAAEPIGVVFTVAVLIVAVFTVAVFTVVVFTAAVRIGLAAATTVAFGTEPDGDIGAVGGGLTAWVHAGVPRR